LHHGDLAMIDRLTRVYVAMLLLAMVFGATLAKVLN
jgi:hypothetical protein